MPARTTPTPVQRIRYICGQSLPAPLTDWVLADLTGPGATRRYLLRFLVPVIAPLCLLLLLPGPLWMHLSMMGLLYIPLVYFTVALLYVYRRHRLIQHGLELSGARRQTCCRRCEGGASVGAHVRRTGRRIEPVEDAPVDPIADDHRSGRQTGDGDPGRSAIA